MGWTLQHVIQHFHLWASNPATSKIKISWRRRAVLCILQHFKCVPGLFGWDKGRTRSKAGPHRSPVRKEAQEVQWLKRSYNRVGRLRLRVGKAQLPEDCVGVNHQVRHATVQWQRPASIVYVLEEICNRQCVRTWTFFTNTRKISCLQKNIADISLQATS